MRRIIVSSLILLIFSQKVMGQSEISINEIDSCRFEMYRCAHENRLKDVADFYSKDAVVNGFDVKLNGMNEIRNYWKEIKGKGVDWSWEIQSTIGTDNLIFQSGISHLTLNYGKVNKTYSSFFTVKWEKQDDWEWRIISDEYFQMDQFNFFVHDVIRDSTWIYTGTDSIFSMIFKPSVKNNERSPAIFCLQGGGNVGKENYYFEAEMFAKAGIVAMVCDKSGAGKSKGISSWITQNFDQKTDEYLMLYEWLSKQMFVDSTQMGVHGPSEGGRLALAMAIKRPKLVKFVNAVSAPLETLKENQLYAIKNLLISQEYSYSVIATTLFIFNKYFDAVKNRSISEDLVEQIDSMRNLYPKLYLPQSSTALPRMPQAEDINFGLETDFNSIDCPIYFQYGSEDRIVNVINSSKKIGKNSKHELKIYKNADHSINYLNGDIHGSYHLDKLKWIYSQLKFE